MLTSEKLREPIGDEPTRITGDSTTSVETVSPGDAIEPAGSEPSEGTGPLVAGLVPQEPHHLPFWTRVALYVVGILFILLGIAGIFLPILQGVLFLLIGAAVLSVASERVYDWMYRLLHRRPKLWGRVHRFRSRVHERLTRRQRERDLAERDSE